MNLNEEQLKGIASQLSCPSGENGLKTAENMALHNSNMIIQSILALDLKNDDSVLEIGPGSGTHLNFLFGQAEELRYSGVDISELMVSEAGKLNAELVSAGKAGFSVSDGEHLDFGNGSFEKVFTVNTLYFWKNPLAYAQEIFRVMQSGGVFSLCFAPKEFMEKLPFTGYVFKLYSLSETEQLMMDAGFEIIKADEHSEVVRSNAGETVDRNFIVLLLRKP